MRSVYLRERMAVGRPLAEGDLLLFARRRDAATGVRLQPRVHRSTQGGGLTAVTLGKLRHSNVTGMREAGIPADVVAEWHGHTERMTTAVYGRVTDERFTAASAVLA